MKSAETLERNNLSGPHCLGVRAQEKERVQAGGGGSGTQLMVRLRGFATELPHLAERGEPPPAAAGAERVQRCGHRSGVGIVGIVQHGYAVRQLRHLHPHARWLERLEAGADPIEADAEGMSGRRRGERIGDVVPTGHGQANGDIAPSDDEPEFHPLEAMIDDRRRRDVDVDGSAKCHLPPREGRGPGCDERIVRVDDRGRRGTEATVEFRLRLRHTTQRA